MREWLAKARKATGKSQQELADEIGIAQSTLGSIESGNRNPSVELAKKIAAALNFPWTRFFE